MSLFVDIEKKLNRFTLRSRFETEGGVLSLLGSSGSGKSMTLKCIAGIEKPDSGRIVLDGKVLFDSEARINLPPQKRHVGYLFQQYALFPNMTVRDNIRCGIRNKAECEKILENIVKVMGLEGLEKQNPMRLSGGQQQRVALARIMVNEPEVLLLDEPFSALDTHLRYTIENEVRNLLKTFNKPVILVSHDKDEVFRLSDKIALMDEGRIEAFGDKEEVFAHPVTRKGAMLTGCRNISPFEKIDEKRLYATSWDITIETDEPIKGEKYVAIRKEDIQLDGEENRTELEIAEEVENPFSFILSLKKARATAAISFEVPKSELPGQVGQKVVISIPKSSVLLLEGDENKDEKS